MFNLGNLLNVVELVSKCVAEISIYCENSSHVEAANYILRYDKQTRIKT